MADVAQERTYPDTVPRSDPEPTSTMSSREAAACKLSIQNLRSFRRDLYWIEGRPELGGDRVVLRWSPDEATPQIVSPPGMSLSSRVHEYGGGAMCVVDRDGALVVGVSADEQALVSFRPGDHHAVQGARIAGANVGGLAPGPDGWILAVVERHRTERVERSIDAFDLVTGARVTLIDDRDFFADPQVTADGARLVWSAWDHPEMPWESQEAWTAELIVAQGSLLVGEPQRIAGGPRHPTTGPQVTPDGSLLLGIEEGEWSTPWRWSPAGGLEQLATLDGEVIQPRWVLGESSLAPTARGAAFVHRAGGHSELLHVSNDGELMRWSEQDEAVDSVVSHGDGVAWMGQSPRSLGRIVVHGADGERVAVLDLGPSLPLDDSQVSVAVPVEVAGPDGRLVAGLLWLPLEPASTPPPVVVTCHGGPTAQTLPGLDPIVQLLCAHGYAVVAANYAGSTGFGSSYRRRLEGAWGVADVEDVAALVLGLGEQGLIDASRAGIRGGSAGGLTALLALTTGVFACGTSWYGVADLLTLAAATHDFESRYLDVLVGPLPEATETYIERSPVTRAREMRGALLLLQGLDDLVVPPSQATAMMDAAGRAGQEVELIEFPGESHGFRRLDTLEAALDAELAFYARHLLADRATS